MNVDSLGSSRPHSARRLLRWASRVSFGNKLASFLIVAAAVSGIATYAALSRTPPFGDNPDTVFLLLNLDLVILLFLGIVIARRIVALWVERRRGAAGARLHTRLVGLFSIVAVAPAIIVSIFSALFLHFGVQSWFSQQVSTAVNNSLQVAQAYLDEHQQSLRGDILAMANDLNREAPRLVNNPETFNQLVSTYALLRNLTEALVVDGTGRPLARSQLTFSLQFEDIPPEWYARARAGEVVLLINENDDRLRGFMRLDRFVDSYLLVGRLIERDVIAHMDAAEGAVAQYRALEGRSSQLQITFALIFVIVALLLMLVAVWLGLMFADTLAAPVSALIAAAERVSDGDLSARVGVATANADEIGTLSRAFNRMTGELESQRAALIEVNEQLDLRRRFTETVLGGVTAGVIGLDENGVVTLPNRTACEFLGLEQHALVGRPMSEVLPNAARLLADAMARGRLVEGQVKVNRTQEPRTLLVRVAPEHGAGGGHAGYVVTFDDISALLTAQRMAAWADVARRIAHEIKNPLTPIQLSAERLKRRYLKQITSDPEVFVTCTDTIVRQVGDIGRMVDEFSAFARMPSPVMKPGDLVALCRQAVDLQRTAYAHITFAVTAEQTSIAIPCDARQIAQVLTNLLQNAIDAIDGREPSDDGRPLPQGEIAVTVSDLGDMARVVIEDNGRGLPTENRDRLTEPYVTHRVKGTGLGLAIVKKIMEDHGGRLTLEDRETGGARIILTLPTGPATGTATIDAAQG